MMTSEYLDQIRPGGGRRAVRAKVMHTDAEPARESRVYVVAIDRICLRERIAKEASDNL